jgi:hypothetical protein
VTSYFEEYNEASLNETNINLLPDSFNVNPFKSFQKDCCEFLLLCPVEKEFEVGQQTKWDRILSIIRIISEFPKTQTSTPFNYLDLEAMATATERLLRLAPRYAAQTSEMSPRIKSALTKAQIVKFVERMAHTRDGYQSQRAFKKDDLVVKLEQLWRSASKKIENQSYISSSILEAKMKAAKLAGVVEKQTEMRIKGQVDY